MWNESCKMITMVSNKHSWMLEKDCTKVQIVATKAEGWLLGYIGGMLNINGRQCHDKAHELIDFA